MPIKEAIIINNLSVPRIKFNQSRIISLSSVKKKSSNLFNYYQEFFKTVRIQGLGEKFSIDWQSNID